MPSTYETILRLRSDMTNWAIHFTKPKGNRTARDVLQQILSDGVLKPGWSVRSGKRTIYGSKPAVCFTEMPLLNFSQYQEARGNQISGYGLLVHKHDLYIDGGRPVIYGYDSYELQPGAPEYVNGQRTLADLDSREQYRYLAFAPTKGVDWSHEREWRWAEDRTMMLEPEPHEVGAFPLAGSGSHRSAGHAKGRVHILVEKNVDVPMVAEWVRNMQVASTDSGRLRTHQERWLNHLTTLAVVISLETVNRNKIGRVEDWPATISLMLANGGPAKPAPLAFEEP